MSVERELTLLSEEQVKNKECQLDILKKYGYKSAMTDLAIVRGIEYSDNDLDEYVPDDKSLKGRIGGALIQQPDRLDGYYTFIRDENKFFMNNRRGGGIRPVLKLPSLEFEYIFKNKVLGYNGVFEVEYGEYPQYAPNESMQNVLSNELWRGELIKTGNKYTFDKTGSDYADADFKPVTYDEYEYGGKKYIRVDCNFWNRFGSHKLSNDRMYYMSGYVWMEVSPVKWLIDEKAGVLISKKILLSGIKYSDVKNYLNNYMLKDLFQTNALVNVGEANIEDEPKEKLVDMLRYLKESGLELTSEQEKIIDFVDNRELRERKQREIRDSIVLENQKKEEWFNSPDNPSNVRLEELRKTRNQVEMLKKIQQKHPDLLSLEQIKLIEYIDMIDFAKSIPHEVDTGMEPEVRSWYSERYETESEDVKRR